MTKKLSNPDMLIRINANQMSMFTNANPKTSIKRRVIVFYLRG
jgi:hypothetical protein